MAIHTNPSRLVADEVLAQIARKRTNRAVLSAAAGIPERTLQRRLNAESPFTLDELVAIAAALDTTVTALTSPLSPMAAAG